VRTFEKARSTSTTPAYLLDLTHLGGQYLGSLGIDSAREKFRFVFKHNSEVNRLVAKYLRTTRKVLFVHTPDIIFHPLHFLALESCIRTVVSFHSSRNMCGESNRPTFGGTIAVLFPPSHCLTSNASERSLSSSPDSIASMTSSVSSSASYSLFFRDTEKCNGNKTKAVFEFNDPETYEALRECQHVDMRIE
jgi:hypothetical protein